MSLGIKLASKFLEPGKLAVVRGIHTVSSKNQTGVAMPVLDRKDVDVEYETAKSYDSIPGPKPLPIPLGNMWRFLPFGTFGNTDMVDIHQMLYKEYGPIVRLRGLGAISMVLLYDPDDVAKLFRNESNTPHRYGLPTMKYYREVVRKDFYQDCPGLVTTNGENWQKFRTATNQVMMQPRNVKIYLDVVDSVADEFLERIRYIRQPNEEMPDDFIGEINKLSLESFMYITLDTRLGCLKPEPDAEALAMIKNVKETMELMYQLDFRPSLWKLYPTRSWKRLVECMDFTFEFTMKHINAKWEKIKQEAENDEKSGGRSILESLLLQTKDPKIPIVMASDTLFAAIDTTSNTLATILYYMAANPEKQESLYQDLKKSLPTKDSPVTNDVLENLKYTRAVIKETMRLTPTTPANQRVTTKDLVFGGYQVPKNTNVVTCNSIMCKMDEHFKEPQEFMPERWLKTGCPAEFSYKNTNPFVYLPFGFGQRSCIGKRFAYMELDVVVSKIIRNFKVSYDHGPMTWKTALVRACTKPLRFKMTERSE